MTNKFYDRNSIQAWERVFSGANPIGIRRLFSNTGVKYVNNEFIEFGGFLYNQNKNYQFITSVTGSSTSTLSIKLSAPFNAGIVSQTRSDISTIGGVLFYTYANPVNTEYSNDIIKYGANESFTESYIESSNINEIDFLINGYREFVYLDKANNDPDQPNGWCYDVSTGFGLYNWYFSSSSNAIAPTYSNFGSGLEEIKINNDYIATLIDYDYFNLDFSFSFSGGNSDDKIEAFLVNQNDLKAGRNDSWELLNFEVSGLSGLTSSINTNNSFSQINLAATNTDGTRRYLVFRPNMSTSTRTTTYVASLSIISIVGGYNPLNNLQVIPATSSTIANIDVDIPESIYTFNSVTNGVTYSLSSKIGNGYFRAGIWENGVWNNGWRDDTEAKDFDDIYAAVLYAYDISWKIKISGSVASCSSFAVGDKVAIGNIVAIDINENRKLIRDYYTISATGSDGIGSSMVNWIEVNLDTTFPYRRIEKDSSNHKIKVTKNVWLSGAFFNGYFSGVWNNGLFKGYPKITEMFNTHWIDGFFNGGHFNSNYPNYYFSDITETINCNYNNITLVFGTVSSFINGQPDDYKPGHNLLPGDYITIDKDPLLINSNPRVTQVFNPEYNGICRVMSVSGNNVVVNKKHLTNLSVPQIGKVTRYAASGLIQNFKFYDTNKSLLKSNESSISSSIFSFNSWIDTNYDNTRSVTLGRDFRSFEPLTGKSVNRNNLYGYPTYDVLSSASRFRNSFDLNYGLYKLGTKYKLFTDFIGDGSAFNEPFDPVEPATIPNFYNAGWTFSSKNSTDLKFNRSEAVISTNNASIFSTTIQDYIDAGVTGNELYLTATNSGAILNNNKINVTKTRYTVVEFDVVTYSIVDSKFTYTNQNTYDIITDSISLNSPAATASNSLTNTSIANTASNIYSLNSDNLLEGSVNFLEGFDGVVYSIDKQADGSLIVAGIFNNYRNSPVNRVCKLNGTTGDLDTTFNTNISSIFTNQAESRIKALVVPSGINNLTNKVDWIYVMVNYSNGVDINGNNIKGRIFRVNNIGVEDTTWTNKNYGFNNSLTDIALDTTQQIISSPGDLYIIGQFTTFAIPWNMNYANNRVLRVNKLCILDVYGDISLKSEFTYTDLAGGSTNDRFFVNVNDIPSTIAILPDGRIVIGGNITQFRQTTDLSTSTSQNLKYTLKGIIVLKKYDRTAAPAKTGLIVDTSFVGVGAPSQASAVYPTSSKGFATTGFNDFINKIKVDSLNRIYVVGNFNGYNDGSPRACFNIARLTSTGAYDNTFINGQGLDKAGYDIELSSNFVYVAGLFTKYNNLDCGKVIKLNITNGSLVSSVGLLDPITSVVRAIKISNNNLIIGGSFETYKNIVITTSANQTITTSVCVQSLSILPVDIINLAVEISLDCTPSATSTGSDLGNIIINLKSPAGKVINLKDSNGLNNSSLSLNAQTKLTNTIFDYSSTILLSSGTSPYSGTFSMEKIPSRGTSGFISDTITSISNLFIDNDPTSTTQGNWTIYIQNDNNATFPRLINWKLITTYKNYENDSAIEITPSVDLPILHFNNLNYEIGSQPTPNGQSNLIYRRMSYLPITQNIDHLLAQNSFRFDSIEKTSAERSSGFGTNTIKKKYEYFYNKTDLMMSIQGNGEMGASQSMMVLDNIKMYETDMIPFFKYFEDANIYKGIQVPYEGIAPNIDYLNSDFIFIDNITIGLDSINNTIIDNNFVCIPNTLIITSSTITVTTAEPTTITQTSVFVDGNITIQGNTIVIVNSGVLVGTNNPLEVGSADFTVGFLQTVSGLTQDTTYNVRAYVTSYELYATGGASSQTTTYGATLSFTTIATPPDYSNDYSGDYSQ